MYVSFNLGYVMTYQSNLYSIMGGANMRVTSIYNWSYKHTYRSSELTPYKVSYDVWANI